MLGAKDRRNLVLLSPSRCCRVMSSEILQHLLGQCSAIQGSPSPDFTKTPTLGSREIGLQQPGALVASSPARVSSVAIPWLGFAVCVAGHGWAWLGITGHHWASLPQLPFPPHAPLAAADLFSHACHYPHPCQIHLLFSPEGRNLNLIFQWRLKHIKGPKVPLPVGLSSFPRVGAGNRSLGHSGHVRDHGVTE